MKTIVRYACEICGNRYNTPKEAEECEALGFPDPMPFLPLDKPIPAFGEDGVVFGQITKVFIAGYDYPWHKKHYWIVDTKERIRISHNQEDSTLNPDSFDPRVGYDAFRYACSQEDFAIWQKALADYGMTEDDAKSVGEQARWHLAKKEK